MLPPPFFPTQPLDLENCSLSVHIFTLNEDGPSMLTLEEDEELSAANHWLLPAGETEHCSLSHWKEHHVDKILLSAGSPDGGATATGESLKLWILIHNTSAVHAMTLKLSTYF